jgi:hypothetical protein
MAAEACTIEIKLEPDGINFHLLIYPTLMQLETALKNAGLSAGEPPPLDEEG